MASVTVWRRDASRNQALDDDFPRKLAVVRFIAQSFQRQLDREMTLKAREDYLDGVTSACPWLSRKVAVLSTEHARLREAARWLVYRIDAIPPANLAELADIGDDFARLVERVNEHAGREAALMYEAINRDSGGEG